MIQIEREQVDKKEAVRKALREHHGNMCGQEIAEKIDEIYNGQGRINSLYTATIQIVKTHDGINIEPKYTGIERMPKAEAKQLAEAILEMVGE